MRGLGALQGDVDALDAVHAQIADVSQDAVK
jgi:hypothetical protein